MPDVHVLSFHGELDSCEKWRIEQQLDQIEKCGAEAVAIIDLTDVRYLDSVFLNALARVGNRMRNELPDSRICIAVPQNSFTSRLFEITNLDRTFSMFDNMQSAHRYAKDAGSGTV